MKTPMSGEEIARTVTPPPTPWIMRGRLFTTLQRHEGEAPPLPHGLRAHFAGHRVVTLVRYLEGTLRYDELILGRVARRGFTLGLFVDHIWVDSPESVAGGRRFWGLPKEMAAFHWTGDRVEIEDAAGQIAALSVNQEAARTPEITVSVPGFGQRDGALLLGTGKLKIRPRPSSLRVESLAPRFGRLLPGIRMGLDASPFELTMGDAKVL
ncbi:MAG: acetoacetate decarboxylase family protein [Minicystis sp.]